MAIIIFYVVFLFGYLLVQSKRCPPPIPPMNGYYSIRRVEYVPRDEIKYSCENGTYLYGSNVRKCLDNGTWNGTSPYCASSLIRKISNEVGKVVLNLTDRNYFTCVNASDTSINLSFHYDGKITTGIILRLVWKDTIGNNAYRYVKVKQKTLKEKGKYTNGSITSVEYDWPPSPNKDFSFHIIGTASSWKKKNIELCEVEIFTERDEECPVLSIQNGDVSYEPHGRTIKYGSAAVTTCKEGYRISGKLIRYCYDDGQWIGGNSSCEEVQCEQLDEIQNGRIISDNRNYKGVAKLHCDKGYIPLANKEVTCQSDGKWAEHNFTCNLIDCGKFYNVSNGKVSYSNTTLHGIAMLRCNEGYRVMHETNSTCLNNASWSYANFKCKQILCSNEPPKPSNGMKLQDNKYLYNATVGERVALGCLPGYTKTLEKLYVECLMSGMWSKINGTCKKTAGRKYIIIAASVGAVSATVVFICCLAWFVLLKRHFKKRQQTDAHLPLNEIVERRASSEKHEYSAVVYEEIQEVRKKKPTSPLPKIPSGEDEFSYSFPIDQKKDPHKCSGSDIYVVPEDAFKAEGSVVQTSHKRRNSSADSTYWRKYGEYLGDISSIDTTEIRKLGSNTSLPDFPASVFSLCENDLYSSD